MTVEVPPTDTKLGFAECVALCFINTDFVAQFDRLMGCNLSRRGSALDLAIDDATGRPSLESRKFIAFVYQNVWMRLPAAYRSDEEVTPVPEDLALLEA